MLLEKHLLMGSCTSRSQAYVPLVLQRARIRQQTDSATKSYQNCKVWSQQK